MIKGELVVVEKKKILQVKFTNRKGNEVKLSIREAELSQELTQRKSTAIGELNGLIVDLEVGNDGQPRQVREQGKPWQAPSKLSSLGNRAPSQNRRSSEQNRAGTSVVPGDFHNPYNFIPALPRQHLSADHPLGDSTPVGHGIYHPDRWSGTIAVELTTMTPLLIPDAAKAEAINDEHKIYPIRVGPDGRPYLPSTSIKGMLRSAYEAITNSRLSIFEKHSDRLAYRAPAEGKSNQYTYPARVEQRNNQLYLRILAAPDLLDKAGKLPRYRTKAQAKELDKGESNLALTYEGNSDLPKHGDSVWVRLNLQQNDEANLPSEILKNLKVGLKPRNGSVKLPKAVVTRIRKREPNSPPPGQGDWHKGWVYVTGANISGKRYERVFIEHDDDSFIPVNENMKTLWKDLILDYQKQHKRDLEKRQEARPKPQQPQDYLGDEPGKTGWSTYIYQAGIEVLDAGTLCYVELKTALEDSRLTSDQVKGIFPVVLSRRLYTSNPEDLLDQSLKPARSRAELSPVDRVFGWVNQNGKGAYKGNLRIGSVQCLTKEWREDFGGTGLPLAILGQPKPQQARFYIAKDQQGTPLDNGTSKANGYQTSQKLRGRKVYAHHRGLPSDYWHDPLGDRTQQSQNGFYQEFRRPKLLEKPDPNKPKRRNVQLQYREQQDDQNRSIQAWVKPTVTFQFTINVTNLSQVELGALLWLLSLPDDHYHRLGAGKPLGFGSVRLAICWSQTVLRMGRDWQKFYLSFDKTAANPADVETIAKAAISTYCTTFEQAYGQGKPFAEIPIIRAFYQCAKGFEDGKPIHYPRARQQSGTDSVPPHPEGKAFEWFVANDRVGGPKVSLPALWDDHGLPLLDKS